MMLNLSKSSLVFVAHVLSNVAKEGGERLKTSRFFSILPINRDLEVIFFCILANRKRQIVIRSSPVLAVRLKLRSLRLNANDAQIYLILETRILRLKLNKLNLSYTLASSHKHKCYFITNKTLTPVGTLYWSVLKPLKTSGWPLARTHLKE